MRLIRKVLGFSLLAAGVVYLRGRRAALRAARGADVRSEDNFGTPAPTNEYLVDVATQSGIANVDPEPLSQVAGEGIDPVRDVAAQNELAALRERMPRH